MTADELRATRTSRLSAARKVNAKEILLKCPELRDKNVVKEKSFIIIRPFVFLALCVFNFNYVDLYRIQLIIII